MVKEKANVLALLTYLVQKYDIIFTYRYGTPYWSSSPKDFVF